MKKKYVKREVIESKLLAALDDEDKVAIVLSEDDCEILIAALESVSASWEEKARDLADGIRQLKEEAFGNGN